MSLLSWDFTSLTLFWNEVQNFLRRVNFNIILSSANKSDAFIWAVFTKELFLQVEQSWKEEGTLFLLKIIVTKMCFPKFWLKISPELLKATLNFILNFLSFEIYHKNQVHGSDHVVSNILHKSVITLMFHICIKTLSLVWFLRIYLVLEQIRFMNQILIYIHVFAHKTPGKDNSRTNIC